MDRRCIALFGRQSDILACMWPALCLLPLPAVPPSWAGRLRGGVVCDGAVGLEDAIIF